MQKDAVMKTITCSDNSNCEKYLTISKRYYVEKYFSNEKSYLICDDTGIKNSYGEWRFN